jgi:hypothetical protein
MGFCNTTRHEALDLVAMLPQQLGALFRVRILMEEKAMKQISLGKIAIATTAFACTALFSFSWSEQRGVSLSIESAQARVGRPLTPMSVAGVARRQNRRAAYGYGAGVVGAGVAAGAIGAAAYYGGGPYAGTGWGYYGGYPGNNYGSYGYPGGNYGGWGNRSYVTGRPTLFPRYYGGTYAAGGYPGYYGGVYANRSYLTGRPTLFPRYYSGWGW